MFRVLLKGAYYLYNFLIIYTAHKPVVCRDPPIYSYTGESNNLTDFQQTII